MTCEGPANRLANTVIPSVAEKSAFGWVMAQRKQFYVYLMASRSRTLYVGVTSDLAGRTYQHKHKLLPGFTSHYNIDRLVYFEVLDDARSAITREKQLKKWSRAKKVALIESVNATWADLSDGWYSD